MSTIAPRMVLGPSGFWTPATEETCGSYAGSTSASEKTSTATSIRTRLLVSGPTDCGLIDTSVAVGFDVLDRACLPLELAVSTITLAELSTGPLATGSRSVRLKRARGLSQIESIAEVIAFDRRCATAYARIYLASLQHGRKARGRRAMDLLIAATALAHGLPIYTLNASDLRGLERLIDVVDLGWR